MKTFFFKILSIVCPVCITSCSESDNSDLTNNKEPTPEESKTFTFKGNTTSNYKVNLISSDSIPINTDKLNAELDGKTVEINRVDEKTWAYLFSGLTISENDILLNFKINDDSYTISHKIQKIQLKSTPQQINDSYLTEINNAKKEISDPKLSSVITNHSNVFNHLWSNASQEEKQQFAEFYSVNKEIFDKLIDGNQSDNQNNVFTARATSISISDSNKQALVFGASIFTLGESIHLGAAAVRLGRPLIASAFVLSASVSFISAEAIWENFSNKKLELVKMSTNSITPKVFSVNNSTFQQNEGQTKSYPINITLQNISENSKSPILSRVWNNYKSLVTITSSINSVINFVNDFNPFSNIPVLSPPKLPPALSETRTINEEEYYLLAISKGSSKLEQIETFSGSGINLNFNKKENEDYNKIKKIQTSVGISLDTDFGSVNTNLPIEVLIKDCNEDFGGEAYTTEECDVCVGGNTGKTEEEECKENPFIGNWTAISFNGGYSIGELVKSGFISECNVYSQQWTINSASANITESNISVNGSQKTGASRSSSSEGVVDCESFNIEFRNDNFTINDSYTIKSDGIADLDTQIEFGEGESEPVLTSVTLKISGSKLVLNNGSVTLTFEK
ncbi:HMG-box domain-containing protein [Wenyingzhuangia aestuarii]|uniref:hypothetical protein n=1 Tax=Wenyingzhuangia aestuarii TaxID=1647582 RepID=UPI00143BA84F|nr:hypothetical protein [Wenyingzhuangia aestuarii]NJB84122.1 hypothetical protein [Wenyingzhuangia aestuarii]